MADPAAPPGRDFLDLFTGKPPMIPAHLDALLAPVAPDSPGGTDASYSQEYDDIRRFRQGDDPTLSQGEWVRDLKTPQWPKVRDLCERLLKDQSKDLQVACWYTESISYLEGFLGLAFGLRLLDGLLARSEGGTFLHPKDPEEQIARLEWLNVQIPWVIKSLPMTSPKAGGYSCLRWEESRLVENAGIRDPKAKETAIAEGKLSGEAWDKAVRASGQGFYLQLFEQLRAARRSLEDLENRIDHLYKQEAPGLLGIREALLACSELAGQMLKRFGLDPRAEAATAPALDSRAPAMPVLQGTRPDGSAACRADAIQRLREAAKYFRDHEPHSPVGPLAERAARWGEMPLDRWLAQVIKDQGTLSQLRELLDLQSEL